MKREREREKRGRENCPELLFLFLKGVTGALAPFSYLGLHILQYHQYDFLENLTIVNLSYCPVLSCLILVISSGMPISLMLDSTAALCNTNMSLKEAALKY